MSGPLRLAFCAYRYSPWGGLERNLLGIARECARRGHHVRVHVRGWEGPRPDEVDVHELPVSALTNVGKDLAFVRALRAELAGGAWDCVVGFNRMDGLDVYYAADPCLAWMLRDEGPLARAARRRRVRLGWERAIFGATSETVACVLTVRERERYHSAYGTPAERLVVLPPNVDRPAEGEPDEDARRRVRRELGVDEDAPLALFVGSDFGRKGLDRVLTALSIRTLAAVHLAVVGAGRERPWRERARRRGLAERVHFTGGREDVAAFYAASDVLLHPARVENTGTVILEGLVRGLPVIASEACGFAPHVAAAAAGIVVPEPFAQADFERALLGLVLDPEARARMSACGRSYAARADLYDRHARAADVIEHCAARRAALP